MSITVISILTDKEAKEKRVENQLKVLKGINNLITEYGHNKAIINEFNNIELKLKDQDIFIYSSNYNINNYEIQFANMDFEKEYFINYNYFAAESGSKYNLGYFKILSIIEDIIFNY